MEVEKRFSSGLSALASYTWGKALTEGADHLSTSFGGPGVDIGVFSVPQNPNDLKAERGPAEFDVTHRLVVSYVYELPWGRGRRWGQSWSRDTDLIFGDWQVSGIHVVQGGLPLTATLSGITVLNLGSDRVSRPNLVGDPELPESQRTVERWFNTDAFTDPESGSSSFRQCRCRHHARSRLWQTSISRWRRIFASMRTATSNSERSCSMHSTVRTSARRISGGKRQHSGEFLWPANAADHSVRAEGIFLK